MKYIPGMILKRKYPDYGEVTLVSVKKDYTSLKDNNGLHFVSTKMLETHFDIIENDDIVQKVYEHSNLDNPQKHNISGSMNKPSRN